MDYPWSILLYGAGHGSPICILGICNTHLVGVYIYIIPGYYICITYCIGVYDYSLYYSYMTYYLVGIL